MKSLSQIRSDHGESLDPKKLTVLARSGLFEPEKLYIVRRALKKSNEKLSKTEREVLLDVFEKLLSIVTTNQDVFLKVRQGVARSISEGILDKVAVDVNVMPAILIMKRRAIRVFPDGQKVALYWVDKLNRYISVPFQSIGISDAASVNETWAHYRGYEKLMNKHAEAKTGPEKQKIQSDVQALMNKPGWNQEFKNKAKQNWNTTQAQLLRNRQTSTINKYVKQKREELKKQTSGKTSTGSKIGDAFMKGYRSGQRFGGNIRISLQAAAAKRRLARKNKAILATKIMKEFFTFNQFIIENDPNNPNPEPNATPVASQYTASAIRAPFVNRQGPPPAAGLNPTKDQERLQRRWALPTGGSNYPQGGNPIAEKEDDQTKANTSASVINTEPDLPVLRTVTENINHKLLDGEVVVTKEMAASLRETYNNMNDKNKKIFMEMINKDIKSFNKILEFSQNRG